MYKSKLSAISENLIETRAEVFRFYILRVTGVFRCALLCIFAVMATVFMSVPACAYTLDLACRSAILIDEDSGKVMYEKNADTRMYPASLTKVLTALVGLEYLVSGEYVVTGPEINEVPWDSSKARLVQGETLVVENLMRLLIIPSGNETACVVAKAVALRADGVADMDYMLAESLFCGLMNERARQLGATGTNFVNPHGYHSDNHYTTARDMALIARAAMQNELISEIVGEMEFKGNGAGDDADPAWRTQEYDWPTHNGLIIQNSEFFYSFATGIKTGFTDEAGYCLAASAEKDGRKLIAIVMQTDEEAERYRDAKMLFEFGFNNFNDEIVQSVGEELAEVKLSGVRLGESDTLKLTAAEEVVRFMSMEELGRIEREITVNPELLSPGTDEVLAPIDEAQPIADIKLSLNGETIYEGKLLAANAVEERTFKSDAGYYFMKFVDAAFSLKAVPFWIGGVVAILLVIRIVITIRRRKQRRRNPYRFVKHR